MIPKIIEDLKEGLEIGLITDAGMPGISDPGSELAKELINEGLEFSVLPGPSASLVGLVLSGLDTEEFIFKGFLSEKASKRQAEINNLKDYRETIILYEAPHRIKKLIVDLESILGDRKVSISRELTKYYEETIRSSLSNLVKDLDGIKEKGEFVIVIEGKKEEDIDIDISILLKDLLDQGFSKKDAVKKIVKEYNLKKNEVYEKSLEL